MNGKSMIILSILYRCGTSSNEVLVTHSFSLGNQSIISPNSKICTRRKYDTNSNKTYFNDLQQTIIVKTDRWACKIRRMGEVFELTSSKLWFYFNDFKSLLLFLLLSIIINPPPIIYIQTLPDKATFRPIKRIKLFIVQHILKFDTLLFILLFILLFNCLWMAKQRIIYLSKEGQSWSVK